MIIYRRSLFSPRTFRPAEGRHGDVQVGALPSRGGRELPASEVALDCLTFMLSPERSAWRSLNEIYDFVGRAEARLCLRAQGELPRLLSAAKADNTASAKLVLAGIYHSISLDAPCAAELLEASLDFLLASIEAEPEALEPKPLPEGPMGLKRRRGQEAKQAEVVSETAARVLARACAEDTTLEELGGSPARARSHICLLVLWRCLGHLQTAAPAKLWDWLPARLRAPAGPVARVLLWEIAARAADGTPPRDAVAAGELQASARDALENPGSERGLLACLRALHRAGVVVPEVALQPLVAAMGTSGAVQRAVLGVLANSAAQSTDFCQALSQLPAQPWLPWPGEACETFGAGLTKAVAWYSEHLSGDTDGDVEVHVTFAMASLLLAWLAKGCEKELERELGRDQLVDLLRTFMVFQDRCGSLTDASLMGLHAAMQFLGEKRDMTPPKVVRRSTSRVEFVDFKAG
ncbi:unnamed protein product [Effrenium voratum]|nr:unnamed protein product [Effrenium voratum]